MPEVSLTTTTMDDWLEQSPPSPYDEATYHESDEPPPPPPPTLYEVLINVRRADTAHANPLHKMLLDWYNQRFVGLLKRTTMPPITLDEISCILAAGLVVTGYIERTLVLTSPDIRNKADEVWAAIAAAFNKETQATTKAGPFRNVHNYLRLVHGYTS